MGHTAASPNYADQSIADMTGSPWEQTPRARIESLSIQADTGSEEQIQDLDEQGSYSVKTIFPNNFSNTNHSTYNVQVSFIAEQEWEGYVTEITKSDFAAILADLTNPGVEEIVHFPIEEVSEPYLLKVGALFRWSIGYERLKGGTRKRVSSIVFRRLPAWSKREVASSLAEAEELYNSISWE